MKPNNHGVKWLVEDYINLAEMVEEGMPMIKIARVLQRTVGSCRSKYCFLRAMKRFQVAGVLTQTLKLVTLNRVE